MFHFNNLPLLNTQVKKSSAFFLGIGSAISHKGVLCVAYNNYDRTHDTALCFFGNNLVALFVFQLQFLWGIADRLKKAVQKKCPGRKPSPIVVIE